MKVCDYDLDFSSKGVFNCCFDEILGNNSTAKVGMVIECDTCGKRMRLEMCDDGVIRWRGIA
jgi:hypothetical protein